MDVYLTALVQDLRLQFCNGYPELTAGGISSQRTKSIYKAFFVGFLIAFLSQGWMLGTYITGLEVSGISLLFVALIAITLPAIIGYNNFIYRVFRGKATDLRYE